MAKNTELTTSKRQHKATWARDNRNGGYLVRVEGPYANRFARRQVPVTKRDGTESTEQLLDLIWSGQDQQTSAHVALYGYEPHAPDQEEAEF